MALFGKGGGLPIEEVNQLRGQGLSDNQIIDQLKGKGASLQQINDALAQAAIAPGMPPGPGEIPPMEGAPEGPPMGVGGVAPPEMGPPGMEGAPGGNLGEDLYGRVEEIAEGIIDEKWDLLIKEVKKIIEWKEKVEEDVGTLKSNVDKLKEDFKELHQGVLGKLESYDEKMTEVGTELKAVGKVFKDVVPEFVTNVKELKKVTKVVKKKK